MWRVKSVVVSLAFEDHDQVPEYVSLVVVGTAGVVSSKQVPHIKKDYKGNFWGPLSRLGEAVRDVVEKTIDGS